MRHLASALNGGTAALESQNGTFPGGYRVRALLSYESGRIVSHDSVVMACEFLAPDGCEKENLAVNVLKCSKDEIPLKITAKVTSENGRKELDYATR